MRKVARKVWKLLLFSQLYAPIKTGLIQEFQFFFANRNTPQNIQVLRPEYLFDFFGFRFFGFHFEYGLILLKQTVDVK